MDDFDLGERFDVVVCLFSAIGYTKHLDRANGAMARHVAAGGVLIVEPWFSRDEWKPGTLFRQLPPRSRLGSWARCCSATARDDRRVDPLAVRLRPFDEADLALFDRFATSPELSEPYSWFGFTAPETFRRRWHEDRFLATSPYFLTVTTVEYDQVVGWVNWRQNERPGPGVWEVGVLIVPEMRGRGAGTAAQRLLVDYLFATTTARRIWAGTEVDNIAEQRALTRCGFHQEGRLRGDHYRDGRWRDSFVYGILRDDPR